MKRWHDRLVGAWCGFVGAAAVYVVWELLTSPWMAHVLSVREIAAMAAAWIAVASLIGLPLLIAAVAMNRRLCGS
jgi:hypothetical protein